MEKVEQQIQIISSDDGFTTSLKKALFDIDPHYASYKGLIMTGTHAPEKIDVDWAVEQIRKARTEGTPTLGICFGLHMGVIEYARNVLHMPHATTAELHPDSVHSVTEKLPGMRCGVYPVGERLENHWHRYRINNGLLTYLHESFRIKGVGDFIEELEIPEHPFFVLTQYHPEYGSFPWEPHPVLEAFIKACKKAT